MKGTPMSKDKEGWMKKFTALTLDSKHVVLGKVVILLLVSAICGILMGCYWCIEHPGEKERWYDNNVSIRELGKRVNWNENNGKTKDFILTVRYMDEGIVFCPSFIVHPMEREEDFPKDMETVVMNEPGLCPR